MGSQLDDFFTDLQRRAEGALAVADNEAIRHDLLVRPLLTNPLALGWEEGEVLSQVEMQMPLTVAESYYWRGAIPKRKRPDIVLVPYNIGRVVGVIEEKGRHAELSELELHVGQLLEYQYLHRCVWGLLTDGEKWVLTKNHEIFQRFENLSDVKRRIADLQQCIGRAAIMERFHRYGTYDLVYVRPSPSIIIVGFPGAKCSVATFGDFLRKPSNQGRDIVLHLFKSVRTEVYRRLDDVPSVDFRSVLSSLYGSGLSNFATPVVVLAELLLSDREKDESEKSRLLTMYERSVLEWSEMYPVFLSHADNLSRGVPLNTGWLMDFCKQVDCYPIGECSISFLNEAKEWCLFAAAPTRPLEHIEAALRKTMAKGGGSAQ
jgi:hypothetical protein